MNLIEVENVFGTLSTIPTPEKKSSWVPILILMIVVGAGVSVLISSQPKKQYYEEK